MRADLIGAACPKLEDGSIDYSWFIFGDMSYFPNNWITAYEVDFTSLANLTLVNGSNTIDGKNWTGANAANAATFAIQNGTGIVIAANTANTNYFNSDRSTPMIVCPLSTFIPSYSVQGHIVRVMARVLLTNCDANFEAAKVGLEDSTTPLSQNFFLNKGFIGSNNFESLSSVSSATTQIAISSTNFTDDVIGFIFEAPNKYELWSGAYSGGFPKSFNTFRASESMAMSLPLMRLINQPRLLLAHQTANGTGAFTLTYTHLRVEYIRKQP